MDLFAEDALGECGFTAADHGLVGILELGIPVGGLAAVDTADQPGTGREPGISEFLSEALVQTKDQGVGSQLEIVIAVGGQDAAQLLGTCLAQIPPQP